MRIRLRERLEKLARIFADRLTVHFVLDNPPANWTGKKGFLTLDTVRELVPAAASDHHVLICGPPPFLALLAGAKGPNYTQGELTGIFKELGFRPENVFKY